MKCPIFEENGYVISYLVKLLENYGCAINCAFKMGAGTEKVKSVSGYGHKILKLEGVYF